MKNIKQYILACVALFMLTACPDDTTTTTNESGDTNREELTLPSNATEQTVTLYKLSSSIQTISSTPSWLKVDKMSYSSGSPQIKLSSEENTAMDERKCNVNIMDISGGKLTLYITQRGFSKEDSEGKGMDDYHNTQTDNPAYSPRR